MYSLISQMVDIMDDQKQKEIFSKNLKHYVLASGKTQKEVADELGISQSYISRLEKKIINKMKKDIMSKTG